MDSKSLLLWRLYCLLQCRNAWTVSTAARCATKTLHEDLHAQCLRIKNVYGQIHATAARQVRNDSELQKADDIEANVSTNICNEVKLYYISKPLADWEKRQDTILVQSVFTSSSKMDTNVLEHMPYEASLEIGRIDGDILTLYLVKPHLAAMKTSFEE